MPAAATSAAVPRQRTRARSRPAMLLSDYVTLMKPRVSLMVIITAGAGFYLGSLRSGISPFHAGLVEALFGIALVTFGSSVLNQALERSTDRRMPRTASRPMAQHRIGLAHGLLLGFALVFGGSVYLASVTNLITGTLTLLTAVGYVAVYTPLKRFTTLNTFLGAFPGALPPLIGWTAARGLIEWPAVALFLILFVWQFPHFMAIGWMYRADYAHAGIRVTATQEPIREAARSSVVQSLFYAVLMIPASLWPTLARHHGPPVRRCRPPAGGLVPLCDRPLRGDHPLPGRPGKPQARPQPAQGVGHVPAPASAGHDPQRTGAAASSILLSSSESF